MGFLKFFNTLEAPKVESVQLKRVALEKKDGRWMSPEENLSYETDAAMLKKIHEQRAKEYTEIKNNFDLKKN